MTPYYDHNGIQIINGHALYVLKDMPDESIHCVVTSPPYWGLRDYGLPAQVWDEGERYETTIGKPAKCLHIWGDELPKKVQTTPTARGGRFGDGNGEGRTEKHSNEITINQSQGQFCKHCNAWYGSLGLEPTPELFIQHMVQIFAEIKRVLRKDGTVWLNLGDSYAGSMKGKGTTNYTEKQSSNTGSFTEPMEIPTGLKPKDLCGIPWRVALALQADGWWLRSDIIWAKPNPMPESCTDRPTKSHEYIFLLAKGSWSTRIVKLPDLSDERFHFGHDLRLEGSRSLPCMLGIGIATSIFNFSQFQHDFSLPPFYSEVWEQCFNESNSVSICGSKELDRIVAISSRFINSKTTLKEFFQEIDSFRLSLPDGDNFLKSRVLPQFSLSPSINCNGNTSISINDSGQICEYDFIHKCIYIKKPSRCQYYYDADAVREPHARMWDEKNIGENNAWTKNLRQDVYPGTQEHPNKGLIDSMPNPTGRNKRSVWTITTKPFTGYSRTAHLVRVELDDVSYGMRHIAFPNCPVHGYQGHSCGEHEADVMNHIQRIDCCHALKSLLLQFYNSKHHEPQKSGNNWDCLSLKCFPFAIDRNRKTHKKDHDVETNPSCISSVQNFLRIVGKLKSHDLTEHISHIHESSISVGDVLNGKVPCLLAQMIRHISSKNISLPIPPDCDCLFYHVDYQESSHFATFPEEIPKTCILAGTSEKGCCPECLAPWVRVVEVGTVKQTGVTPKQQKYRDQGLASSKSTIGRTKAWKPGEKESKTIGWKPGCECKVYKLKEGLPQSVVDKVRSL